MIPSDVSQGGWRLLLSISLPSSFPTCSKMLDLAVALSPLYVHCVLCV